VCSSDLVWIYYAIIGVVCTVALFIFNRMARNWEDMNV
jgi:hypothetical protein